MNSSDGRVAVLMRCTLAPHASAGVETIHYQETLDKISGLDMPFKKHEGLLDHRASF